MVNIINLIRSTDAVDPRIDAEIISRILLPVMTCEKCVRCGDLFQECVECVQQMCTHYYVGIEVTQFSPIISEMITQMEQLFSANDTRIPLFLGACSAMQPLWRQKSCGEGLGQLNSIILQRYNAMLLQQNVMLFPFDEVMAFTIYLTNFCRYSLRDVFVQVADGCREVVQMFIGYTGAFQHELVQLIEAFLQKMYVCGYDNVNQLIIQVLSALYLQMASLVKNNDPQC